MSGYKEYFTNFCFPVVTLIYSLFIALILCCWKGKTESITCPVWPLIRVHNSYMLEYMKYWCVVLFLCDIRHLPDIHSTLEAMLQTKVTSLPGHIQAVYVQNIAKLYAKLLASEAEEVCDLILVKSFFTLKIDQIRFPFFSFSVFLSIVVTRWKEDVNLRMFLIEHQILKLKLQENYGR